MKLDNRIASFASVGQCLLVLCMTVGIDDSPIATLLRTSGISRTGLA